MLKDKDTVGSGSTRKVMSTALAVAVASLLPLHGAAAQAGQAQAGQGSEMTKIETADTVHDFDLPAGGLAPALEEFSAQSGIRLDWEAGLVAGRQVRAVRGQISWREGLDRLLEDSGLAYESVGGGTGAIRIVTSPSDPRDGDASFSPIDQSSQEGVTELDRVEVTGTRIRDGAVPSPVVTVDAQRIQQEGFADLGQVIRSLPQNFSGGQNPGVLMGNVMGGGLANQNVTGGSGLNLRGLGPDASLTLLDGRRLSYGGFVQAVDISAIPVEAVQRIEIVADGASAIYGSDAVGGVGNVILRRDFKGVKVSARYGSATDGGLDTQDYAAIGGATWTGGGLVATFQSASTDPIAARQRGYTDHLPIPTTIYPGSKLQSGLVNFFQSVGDSVEVSLTGLRTRRDQSYQYFYGSLATFQDLAPETTATFVSPAMEIFLPNGWSMDFGGSWGRDERVLKQTATSAATGQGTLTTHNCHCNEIRSYEVGAEGPILTLPAGEARLATGAGRRENEYVSFNYLTQAPNQGGEETARFAYAELSLPLLGGVDTSKGRALLGTAAARFEDYDSFGSVTTPKLGLVYKVNPALTIKTSWGRSFKAPTLYQRDSPPYVQLVNPAIRGGVGYAPDAILFEVGGGSDNLRPERARTYSATLAIHPERMPGLEAEISWFDVNYVDRVVQPINNYSEALTSPIYAEFIDYSPSQANLDRYLASAAIFANRTSGPYNPNRVVALLRAGYVNATRQNIRGMDLAASYRYETKAGLVTLRGSASWLDSTQRTLGMPTDYDLAGTLFNPARVNGRLGVVWESGALMASTFANYTGGVTDTRTGRDGASLTTLDAALRYALPERGKVLTGLEFALTASNLLNREPPLYSPAVPLYVAPYDSTNYSAIGRFVSASISKRW